MSLPPELTIDEFQGGTFGFTKPQGWIAWLGFAFAVVLIIVGGIILMPIISAAGFLGLIASTPAPLQEKLDNLRRKLRPRAVKIRQDEGGLELQSFWNSATIHRPSYMARDWVFPPHGEEEWSDDIYAADKSGDLIPEHPNRVGTPTPPMLSNYGVFGLLAYICVGLQVYILGYTSGTGYAGDETESAPSNYFSTEGIESFLYIYVGLAAVWLLASVFMWKRAQAMADTPTQNIRSMAVGSAELVGQVRRWKSPAPLVIVDGDRSKTVEDLHLWRWEYEVEIEEEYEVTVTDSDGNTSTETRTKRYWQTIRSDSGHHDFILHDGTGGVVVRPGKFRRSEVGDYLVRWGCRHDTRARGLVTNLFVLGFSRGDKRILRHRWTVHGLEYLDPCYMMGTAKIRSRKEMKAEGDVESTRQNRKLEMVGEDAPGFKARLEKGTELTAMGRVRSQVEYLIIPTVCLLGAISMFAI